ncbi:hypothetical protein Dimus_015664 [Dionaea muscipula]
MQEHNMPSLSIIDDDVPPFESTTGDDDDEVEGDDDIMDFMSIKPPNLQDHDDNVISDFMAVEQPRAILVKKDSSFKAREKQIGVDPISLMGSTIRQASFRLVSPPPTTLKYQSPSTAGGMKDHLRLPLPPPKLKFLSASLPSSTTSSPLSASDSTLKMIWKSQISALSPTSPAQKPPFRFLSRHLSAAAMEDSDHDHVAHLQESSMQRRSKSMGEGRSSSPPDDLDLWLEKPSARDHRVRSYKPKEQSSSISKQGSIEERWSKKGKSREYYKTDHDDEEEFKCGKLCLFLPRGKGKPVKASAVTSSSTVEQIKMEPPPVISKRVSLEKFECGSWSSSHVLMNENDHEDEGEMSNLFFDLPLELIRCSVSDMQSPVTAVFVFDEERIRSEKEPRGGVMFNKNRPAGAIIKTNARRSQDSIRHVRFSTSCPSSNQSSPTCITPRLRKAREDFNAFLEAQNA